ncbi:MAG: hypothetical protein K6T26_06100 [Alicyclobacillus sp.]|nr:hypothetical protein [Alicyclobacillus sp.]
MGPTEEAGGNLVHRRVADALYAALALMIGEEHLFPEESAGEETGTPSQGTGE